MSTPLTKHHKDLVKPDKKTALLILGALVVAVGVFGAGQGVLATSNKSVL